MILNPDSDDNSILDAESVRLILEESYKKVRNPNSFCQKSYLNYAFDSVPINNGLKSNPLKYRY